MPNSRPSIREIKSYVRLSGKAKRSLILKDLDAVPELVRDFCRDIFNEEFPSPPQGCGSKDWYEKLFLTVFNLVGCETEGREHSMGILISNDAPPSDRRAAIHPLVEEWDENGPLILGAWEFEPLRRVIRNLQQGVLGWTPGSYAQPIVYCAPDKNFTVTGLGLNLTSGRSANRATRAATLYTPHQSYCSMTRRGNHLAIWIKPASSIRLYARGRLKGQLMRLRDVGGWAVRNVDKLQQYVSSHSPKTFLCRQPQVCREKFIYPAIALSEMRVGGSIYVLPADAWDKELLKEHELQNNFKCATRNGLPWCKGVRQRALSTHNLLGECKIADLCETEFMVYLAQDGCMVFTEDGRLRGAGTYFVGPGGRRKIANFICSSFRGVALVISQDGQIRFYSHKIPTPEQDKAKGLDEEAYESHALEPDGRYVRLDFCP